MARKTKEKAQEGFDPSGPRFQIRRSNPYALPSLWDVIDTQHPERGFCPFGTRQQTAALAKEFNEDPAESYSYGWIA